MKVSNLTGYTDYLCSRDVEISNLRMVITGMHKNWYVC